MNTTQYKTSDPESLTLLNNNNTNGDVEVNAKKTNKLFYILVTVVLAAVSGIVGYSSAGGAFAGEAVVTDLSAADFDDADVTDLGRGRRGFQKARQYVQQARQQVKQFVQPKVQKIKAEIKEFREAEKCDTPESKAKQWSPEMFCTDHIIGDEKSQMDCNLQCVNGNKLRVNGPTKIVNVRFPIKNFGVMTNQLEVHASGAPNGCGPAFDSKCWGKRTFLQDAAVVAGKLVLNKEQSCCDDHDWGYMAPGVTKQDADMNFYKCMMHNCANTDQRENKDKCVKLAYLAYTMVRDGGLRPFTAIGDEYNTCN